MTARFTASAVQHVTAENGFAYGTVGASIHVFRGGTPVYLLENRRPTARPERAWLRALPSRMLSARFAVVGFHGREDELGRLELWRDRGPRLAARWLHGPGGQGKTRLAEELAARSAADGWKVVTATHGPGTVLPPPGSQDLRSEGAAGLLLIVDYADRWPLSDLGWLLSNPLLQRTGTPTRVLMAARTPHAWPSVRPALDEAGADASDMPLAALPRAHEHRLGSVTAARDAFADPYGIDPVGIAPPPSLDGEDLGLTLAVHMAALVAVDIRASAADGGPQRRLPETSAGLTVYLLDREHLLWAQLYENEARRPRDEREFTTPPDVMNQIVFGACLAGARPRAVGTALLRTLQVTVPPAQALTDHAVCYPPAAERGTVLEPLYPDRLAEDFLALTLPGHAADYPARPWAEPAAAALLARAETSPGTSSGTSPAIGPAADYTTRMMVMLAAAAERWPHVGERLLSPLLSADPQLALDAGSAGLTALAAAQGVEAAAFARVEALLPATAGRFDLAAGVAALAKRLTEDRLPSTAGPEDRAILCSDLGVRLAAAGRHAEALEYTRKAVDAWERLAAADPAGFTRLLAHGLRELSSRMASLGRHEEALAAIRRSAALSHEAMLARPSDSSLQADYAEAMVDLSSSLADTGRSAEALACAEKAAGIFRIMDITEKITHARSLAEVWDRLGSRLADSGHPQEALVAAERSVALWEQSAEGDSPADRPFLAAALGNLQLRLAAVGRREQATDVAEQVVATWRALVDLNPAVFEPDLAMGLDHLGMNLFSLGREDEALAAVGEAVALYRAQAALNPARYEPRLAAALDHLAAYGERSPGRGVEPLQAGQEAVDIYRRLAGSDPEAHRKDLAKALDNRGTVLARFGNHEEALAASKAGADILREMAEIDPMACEPDFARALHNLGCRYADTAHPVEAVAACEQSLAIRRRLATADPEAYERDFARSLLTFAMVCHHVGMETAPRAALSAADEAAKLYLQFARAYPGTFDELCQRALYVRVTLRSSGPLAVHPTASASAPVHAEPPGRRRRGIFGEKRRS